MDLNFFNLSGQQIGDGSFTYDDQFPINQIQGSHNNFQIGTFQNWFFITDFEATISGMTWGFTNSKIWDAQNNRTHSVVYNNYGEPSIIDQWLMGDHIFLTTPALMMSQQGFNIQSSNQFLEGQWTATLSSSAVPESPTLLGALTAIGMLTFFKMSLKR
ncbi:hypothetical protein CFPU101_37960 [Chroococcus sp. FPU101]|nr:hypothetical protein CFPU101_37960 [Chroococcus sp. FPU101]